MILIIAAIFFLFAAACTTQLQVSTYRPSYASVPEQGHYSYLEPRFKVDLLRAERSPHSKQHEKAG